ncbi:helix-turn-helix domain-containing protein [Marinibacterium profundimaris]|uniref:helix-turn-helix domain-containing protein n=1 Tax=Marinibacterium profundimaris TaxID=1679460 RepID=UPI000B525C2B|nr:helix-turn-helix transcriptional regulator [Marinibacterium profundimaris]
MTATSPTARMLASALDASDLTQREVAARAGFNNANVLSMMKTGETNIPLVRIPALASVLELDAQEFLMTAIAEYYPPVHEVLVDILGLPLTAKELDAVRRLRMKGPEEEVPAEATAEAWAIEGEFSLKIRKCSG